VTALIGATTRLVAADVLFGPPDVAVSNVDGTVNREDPRILVSPGGQYVYVVWKSGNDSLGVPELTCGDSTGVFDCFYDGRRAFRYTSNKAGRCPTPDYLTDVAYGRDADYYYLPPNLSSIYLRTRDAVYGWAPVETVSVTDFGPGKRTDHEDLDAAIGPDGTVHVVWVENVPNVEVEPADYNPGPSSGGTPPFNTCGFGNGDATVDSTWVYISPDSQTTCNGSPPDSINPDLTECDSAHVACHRQLASMRRINYRYRKPAGAWSEIYHISSDAVNPSPDDVRQAFGPAIAVDTDNWVHVVWAQKNPAFPSCAWRRFQRGSGLSVGDWNVNQFDAYHRSWRAAYDNPETTAIHAVTADTLNGTDWDSIAGEFPTSIRVTGSPGSMKVVHVLLSHAPDAYVYGTLRRYNDSASYIRSADGGVSWWRHPVKIVGPLVDVILPEKTGCASPRYPLSAITSPGSHAFSVASIGARLARGGNDCSVSA
jgi:hypothetical protein